jgi:hypothetical protein
MIIVIIIIIGISLCCCLYWCADLLVELCVFTVYDCILMGNSCWLLCLLAAAPTITDHWTDLNTKR